MKKISQYFESNWIPFKQEISKIIENITNSYTISKIDEDSNNYLLTINNVYNLRIFNSLKNVIYNVNKKMY